MLENRADHGLARRMNERKSMTRWLLSTLIVPCLVSCAATAGEVEARRQAASEAEPAAIDLGEIDDLAPPVEAAEPERSVVPPGTFATLEALCDAQEALIAPTLRAADEARLEIDPDRKIAPHCARSAHAFDGVTISLRAPLLEVAPLEIETGFATEVHVAVRTAEGWMAVPHASLATFYDDPGCFTIERDDGLVAVTVRGDEPSEQALVLVERSVRGAVMDVDERDDGSISVGAWADVTRRSISCSVKAGTIACSEPTVLSVERMKTSL